MFSWYKGSAKRSNSTTSKNGLSASLRSRWFSLSIWTLPSAAATTANWWPSLPAVCRVRSAEEFGPIETVRRGNALIGRTSRDLFGSSLIRDGRPDAAFAEEIKCAVGAEKLVFAIDSREGCVAIRGWRQLTDITPLEMIAALERCCFAFLYTHIDSEGLLQGFPLNTAIQLRAATSQQLIVAGGIATSEQIDELHALRIDAVVGMAPTPTAEYRLTQLRSHVQTVARIDWASELSYNPTQPFPYRTEEINY